MEAHVHYVIHYRGSVLRHSYEYAFQQNKMGVTFDGRGLADLLAVTRQHTLKYMNFERVMEIGQENGSILNKTIKLPDIILTVPPQS